ncbi:hypothetical protein [Chitinimonas arctica]|uniref:hypothetical protein n=1 Tax=Chitinimonas arctica TaxID=2594795 RepID=UPI001CC4ECD2|nr:hypothetical protein [Chitinimonas arctica]
MRKAGVAHRLAVLGNPRGTDWLARLGALLVGVTVLAAPPTINVQRTPPDDDRRAGVHLQLVHHPRDRRITELYRQR